MFLNIGTIRKRIFSKYEIRFVRRLFGEPTDDALLLAGRKTHGIKAVNIEIPRTLKTSIKRRFAVDPDY